MHTSIILFIEQMKELGGDVPVRSIPPQFQEFSLQSLNQTYPKSEQLGSISPTPHTPSHIIWELRPCDSLQKYVSAGGCVLLNVSHSAPLGDNKCRTVNTAIPKWIYLLHLLTRLSFWLRCTTQDWFKCPLSLSFTLLCIRREGCVRPLVRWGETVRFQPAWILFWDGWDLQECLFLSGNRCGNSVRNLLH